MLVRKRVIEQLKYGGVLEAVRVARSGFPVRFDHAAFHERYRVISRGRLNEARRGEEDAPSQADCVDLLDELTRSDLEQLGGVSGRCARIRARLPTPQPLDFPKEDVQLGKTKVFLRKGPHNR